MHRLTLKSGLPLTELRYGHFHCAKGTCLPPGSNLINVNDKERKSLKVSTSLGTLPNAQHCHFNDMITAHKMTTKL